MITRGFHGTLFFRSDGGWRRPVVPHPRRPLGPVNHSHGLTVPICAPLRRSLNLRPMRTCSRSSGTLLLHGVTHDMGWVVFSGFLRMFPAHENFLGRLRYPFRPWRHPAFRIGRYPFPTHATPGLEIFGSPLVQCEHTVGRLDSRAGWPLADGQGSGRVSGSPATADASQGVLTQYPCGRFVRCQPSQTRHW